jgi:hypothetical protein
LLLCSGLGNAHAQNAAAPAAAPTTVTPAPDCVPACQAGFVCTNGSCVSACNPACAIGETCWSDGRCIAAATPGTAPAPTPASAPATPPPAAQAAPSAGGWEGSQTAVARTDESYEFISSTDRIRTGAYHHDGLYLRFGVGGGWMYGQMESDALPRDLETKGLTVPLEFAVGGTPVAGIVIGVGYYGLLLPALSYQMSGGGMAEVDEQAKFGAFAAVVGPFVDFYVRPAFGVHLQASPTLVYFAPGQSDTVNVKLRGLGFGAMLGAGYEIWVAKEWGGGWLLRVQGAMVKLEDEDGNEYDYLSIMPTGLFTITFH